MTRIHANRPALASGDVPHQPIAPNEGLLGLPPSGVRGRLRASHADREQVIEALTLERNASHPRAVLQVLKEHCRDAKDEGMHIVS